MDFAGLLRHIVGKSLQSVFVTDIAHKPVAGLQIYNMHGSSFDSERIRNRLADPVCAACNNHHFILNSFVYVHNPILVLMPSTVTPGCVR